MRWPSVPHVPFAAFLASPARLRCRHVLSLAMLPALIGAALVAADAARGADGSLVICGGGELPDDVLNAFVLRAGGREARLVIIPTASQQASMSDADSLLEPWRRFEPADLKVLHTDDPDVANDEAFVAPLRRATGVWFGGGEQSRIAGAYADTKVAAELKALLARGGVIGGTSAGAAAMSRVMIARGNPVAEIGTGLGLLEGVVIDQHFLQRNRMQRLWGVLGQRPELLGIGIDEGTALVVDGRQAQVVGDSFVVACWQPSKMRPARFEVLKAGDLADLTAWRRAAVARSGEPFPPRHVPPPVVRSGALVVVGGGSLPAAVRERFIELAGGHNARFVVIPSAADRQSAASSIEWLEASGVQQIEVLHATTPQEADTARHLELLGRADAVWFGGGRQWRLVDGFEGTRALEALHGVLKRGGVIGGSSAGATIQGEYLVRGNPLGNTEMIAEGYERGFAFWPGTAIDQHFSQRGRQPDMELLKRAYPQLWGIGVDESTAVVVRRSELEVLGEHEVFIYPPPSDSSEEAQPVVLQAGERYDFRSGD